MASQRKTQHAHMIDYDSRQYGGPGCARIHDSFAIGYVPPAPSSAPFVNGPFTGEPAAYSSANVQHNHLTVHQYAQPEAKTMQQMPNSYARVEEPPQRQPRAPESVSTQGEFTSRIRPFHAPASSNFTGKLYENRSRQFLQPFLGQKNPSTANVSSPGQDFYNQNSSRNTIFQQDRQVPFPDNSIQSIGTVHGHPKKPWGSFDGPGPDAVPFGTGDQYLELSTKPLSSSCSFPGENTGLKPFENGIDQRRVSQWSSVDSGPFMNSYQHQHDLSLQSPISAQSHHQGLLQTILTPQTPARSQKRLSNVPGLDTSMSFSPHARSIASNDCPNHPKDFAHEEDAHALRKMKRRRKDETTKPRKLTADGKVHAKKVRKEGACSACHKRHVKCTHVLAEDIELHHTPNSDPIKTPESEYEGSNRLLLLSEEDWNNDYETTTSVVTPTQKYQEGVEQPIYPAQDIAVMSSHHRLVSRAL